MNLRFTRYLIVLSLLLIQSIFAQQSEDVITLDTVVVQANKEDDTKYQTGDVYLEESPAFYSLIKRDQFEGKIESLAGVIEKEAGVHVNQIGGFGSYSVISLRGSTSDQVMIYLDGILLNDASGGGVDLSNISLADVESIEIYRGIAPANFSNASIGGVVNIKTLRNKGDFAGNINFGRASFDTNRLSAYVNKKLTNLDYVLSAEYFRSENDYKYLNKNRTILSPADWKEENRNNATVRQCNFLGKMGYDFTESLRMSIVNQWFGKDQGIPNRTNSVNSTRFDTNRDIFTVEVTANNIGKYHLNTKTRLSYLWKEEDYDDRKSQIGKGEIHTLDKTDSLNGNFFCEYLTENNSLSLNLDMKTEDYQSIDYYNRKNPSESNRDTYIIGIQNTRYFLKQQLNATFALRLMLIDNFLKSDTDVYGNLLYENNNSENYWMPQFGIKYRILKWLTLKSNIARYVREPSFFELFGDRGYFSGNPSLEAEKGLNYDLGFEINWFSKNNKTHRVKWENAFFASHTKDRIERKTLSSGFYKAVNFSKCRIHGFETSMIIDFLRGLRANFNYTFQHTKNLSDDPVNNGKQIPHCPEQSFTGRIETRLKSVKLYFEHIIVDGMYFDDSELLDAPVKELSNAGLLWRYDLFQMNCDITNIEDNQFEEFYRYPRPGRSISLTVKYSF